MTVAEAAALLGLAPVTIRSAIHRGQLRATKIGRDWWITRRDLERFRAEVPTRRKGEQ